MTIIHSSIFSILKRFPERADVIKRLFSKNEEFQTMCEDYHKCSQALNYWNQSTEVVAPARRKEYAAVLHELEQEIEQRLIKALPIGMT